MFLLLFQKPDKVDTFAMFFIVTFPIQKSNKGNTIFS